MKWQKSFLLCSTCNSTTIIILETFIQNWGVLSKIEYLDHFCIIPTTSLNKLKYSILLSSCYVVHSVIHVLCYALCCPAVMLCIPCCLLMKGIKMNCIKSKRKVTNFGLSVDWHVLQHFNKVLYTNIDLKLRNKLHGPMHCKIGITCVYNGHVFYNLL